MTGTNYTVEEKDTTLGRLAKTIDPSNAALRRSASMASRFATSKGLGSSSINAGAGVGAFLDKSVDIATTDSTNIINTGNQNAVNNTQMRNTDVSTTAQKDIAQLDTDTQRAINAENIRANKENLAADIESKERINSANIDANGTNLDKELSVRERMANKQIDADNMNQVANRTVEQQRIASQEEVAYASILADERKAEFQRANELLMTNLDINSRERIEQMRMDYQANADKMDEKGAAWGQYQAGLASIDPNATSASQNTMFNRLSDAFDARMSFIDGTSYSTPRIPVTNDNINDSNSTGGSTTGNTTGGNTVQGEVSPGDRGDRNVVLPSAGRMQVFNNYVDSVASRVTRNSSAAVKTNAANDAIKVAKQSGLSRDEFVVTLKRNFNMSDTAINNYLDSHW